MRPRVAVVLSGYGVVRRGAETMIEQLLPRLEERFDFDLYSLSGQGPGGRKKGGIPRSEVEDIYLATTVGRKILDTIFLDPIHVEWTTHLLRCLPDLVREGYDVIWHETGRWGGKILAELRRRQGVRLLDVAHSSHPGWEIPFARCLPDAFVTADPSLAELVRQEVDGLRVEVVHQGVDTDLFQPDGEGRDLDLAPPIILIVGALSPEKSPLLGLEAAAEAGGSVVMVGRGPLSEVVDSLASQKLSKNRYLRLEADRSEMPAIYRSADLLVLASPLESGALAVLEAMASGISVVTSSDAVRRRLVGDAGVLVEGRTVEDFALGIEDALTTDWGTKPRDRVLGFSLTDAADRYAEILFDLAGEKA